MLAPQTKGLVPNTTALSILLIYVSRLLEKVLPTVEALIKAPLKNNSDLHRLPCLEHKKLFRILGGALFREAPSN